MLSMMILLFEVGHADLKVTPEDTAPEAHAPMLSGLCRSGVDEEALSDLVMRVGWEEGVEPVLLATIVVRESACDVRAVGSSGELGLTQVHPRVWSGLLDEFGLVPADLLDAETNLRVSSRILRRIHRGRGVRDTLRRYNGSGTAAREYAARGMRTYARILEVSGVSPVPGAVGSSGARRDALVVVSSSGVVW